MNRRNYLAVLGAGALAGCLSEGTGSGTDTETTDEPSDGTPSPTETMQTEETSLSLEAGADPAGPVEVGGLVRVTDVRWEPTRETDAGTGAVVGTIENVGDDALGRQRNRLTLFDEAGDVVGTNAESIQFVRPGATYRFVLPFVGDDPDAVAWFRLDARVWSRPVVSVDRGQFAVDDDGFGELDDGSHGVRGTVTNETDEAIFRVLPHVNFYAGDELLAYGSDGVTDLEAGASAEWQVSFSGESPDDVDDHQVVVVYER